MAELTPLENYLGRNQTRLAAEPIKSAFLGKIFFFWSGRNAWHYTWSNSYPGASAFHLTFQQARWAIERRRVQGSQWRIEELPACVFVGDYFALIVTEIDVDTPLSRFSKVVPISNLLLEIGNQFQGAAGTAVFKFVCQAGEIQPSKGPFEMYESVSYGGNSLLGWKVRGDVFRRRSNAVTALVTRYTGFLQTRPPIM